MNQPSMLPVITDKETRQTAMDVTKLCSLLNLGVTPENQKQTVFV